METQIKE